MKKVLIGLLIILNVLVASAFLFIPKELTVSKITIMHANENVLFRYLSNENKWQKWWPKQKLVEDNKKSYTYNGFTYHLSKPLYQAIEVNMVNEGNNYPGKIILIPKYPDSVAVNWQNTFTTSSNPVTRFLNYQKAKTIRKNMEVILDSLKAFGENQENLYNYKIHRTSIKDTFLVASKIATSRYPSVEEIYGLVGNLKRYIESQGAKETNFPMLNVTRNDSIHYSTMVAIPTNKKLEGNENISLKQMIIYKDKTVTAEVKGGPEAIKAAYKELDIYMNDYNLSTPVIHWESLITDRSKEKDSTKWITRIFMPIV